jgi:hypothetical protein
MKSSTIIFFRRVCLCSLVYYGAALMDSAVHAQDMITVMTEQIAKLELYLQEAKKGYSIVQTGLNTISQIKKGDLDLHSLFFSSLSTVNPAIKNWGKVADIIAMESQIFIGCATTLTKLVQTNTFSSQDIQYVTAVYSNIKTLSSKDIDELTGLVTDGNWQMTDDQRMSRIDQLFNSVGQKYTFLMSLAGRLGAEAQNRSARKLDLQNVQNFFKP